jgi:hypothetical protein
MSMHEVSLWRENHRTEFRIEGDTFEDVLGRLAPYLHAESHIAHTGTDSDMIRLALLRADVERKYEAFHRSRVLLQNAESGILEGQMERGATDADSAEVEGQES